MILRNLIRIIVLKTNSIWPFNYLNRIPYYLAIKIFIRIFSVYKEIKSIYLRHGLSEKNWVPGISDIDLTIIIDGNLSKENSYLFLQVFWKKFEKVKKFFPMLGEADIINDSEIKNWTKFSIRGYESRNWKLLYGEKNVESNYSLDPNTLSMDSLNYAITTYLEYFIPKFYSDETNRFIKEKELSRLTSKIFRYAKSSLLENDLKIKNNSDLYSELLCNILKKLKSSIENNVPKVSIENDVNDISQSFHDEDFNSNEINLKGISDYKNQIASFKISYTVRFIILKDDLKDEEIIDCVEAIRKNFSKLKVKPVILNKSLFEYLVRIYNPFVYSQLVGAREILLGDDLFLSIKQPDILYYKKALLEEIGNIILFPKKHSLISPLKIQPFLLNGFVSDINRILFLKLFLEKKILKTDFADGIEECKKNYSVYIKQTEQLITEYDSADKKKLSFDTYSLLNSLTEDIHKALLSHDNYREIAR